MAPEGDKSNDLCQLDCVPRPSSINYKPVPVIVVVATPTNAVSDNSKRVRIRYYRYTMLTNTASILEDKNS